MLTLRRRFLAILTPLLVLVLALGGFGTALLGHLGTRIDAILRENYASVLAMQRLRESVERIDSSFQFALDGQTATAVSQYKTNWHNYRQSLALEQANITLPGEKEAVDRLVALTGRYQSQGDAFMTSPAAPQRRDDYFGRDGLLETFYEIKAASREILKTNENRIEQASGEAMRTASLSVTALSAALAVTFWASVLLAWKTSRSVADSIRALTKSAVAVSRGDLEQQVPYAGNDEIAEFARAFNHMVDELRTSHRTLARQTAALARAEEKYRGIVENAVEGSFQTTPQGRFLTANQALAQMLGYESAGELVASVHDIAAQLYLHPEQRIELAGRLTHEGVVRGFETEWIRKDGSTISLSMNIRAVRDDQGITQLYEGFASDVGARKQAERDVARLAHLQAVVAEIGQRALRLDPSANLQQEVVQRVAAILDVELVGIMELCPDGESFLLRAGVGWPQGLVGHATIFAEGSQPGFSVQSDQPVVVPDEAQETRFVPAARLLGVQLRSSVSVVIPMRTGAYGALGAHAQHPRVFAKDEVDFLRSVANVLGAAIERLRAEDAVTKSEANLNRAQEIARIGSWNLDIVRNRLFWSPEVFRIFGIPEQGPVTYETFLASIHPEDRADVEQAWAAALRGASYDVEHRIVVPDMKGGRARQLQRWVRERAEITFDASGNPLEGIGTVQDITQWHQIEEQLRRVNRALRAVSSCNHALVRATNELPYMEQICRNIVDEAGYRLCWVGQAEHDERKTVLPIARAGFDEGYLDSITVTWSDTELGRGPTGTAIRTGQVVVAKDIARNSDVRPWRAAALERGYASSIAIPIVANAHPIGALNIYASEPDAFAEPEVALLKELAADLSYGIAALRTRTERDRALAELRGLTSDLERRVARRTADLEAAYEREASIGSRIQQQLLLDEPPRDVPGLRLAALTVPSQRIAGDFYGFFRHEANDCLDLLVADVMGKGVPAALLGAATKNQFPVALWHLLSTAVVDTLPEPHDIVTLAHTQVARQLIDIETFVTLCYTRIDVTGRRIVVVDCGHTGILHWSARAGRSQVLHGENLPLGIREGEIYGQICVAVEPEDILVFYSDGVTEARRPDGEMFGVDRLTECVGSRADADPSSLVNAIRDSVVAFSGSHRLADDLTCVVAKLAPYEAPIARALAEIGSSLGELRRAREFVEGFGRSIPGRPLSGEALASLVLAVNEAASNIIKHAYHGRGDQRIDIAAEAFSDRLSIRLRYLGPPFDRSAVAPAPLNGSRESGFGVFIIEKSVDRVDYYRDDLRRSCIRLEKLRQTT